MYFLNLEVQAPLAVNTFTITAFVTKYMVTKDDLPVCGGHTVQHTDHVS